MMLGLGSTPCVQWGNGQSGAAAIYAAYGCDPSDSDCLQGALGAITRVAQNAAANGGCITGNLLTEMQAFSPQWVTANTVQPGAPAAVTPAPTPTPVSMPAPITMQTTTTSTPAMIPGAGTSAAMNPTPTPSAIQPVTSTPVVPVATTSTPTTAPAPAASSSTGNTTTTTTGSTIIPGIPDTYVYLGGAALVLFMLMGGKK